MAGLERRVSNIFSTDGRSLIVAFDHGLGGANYAGMATPELTLNEVLGAGADAVLTTIGIARKFERLLSRTGLIISFDRVAGDVAAMEAVVREAVMLGADMGKVCCFPWNDDVADGVERVRTWATVCHYWGLPLMIETIPISFEATESHTPEQIGRAARIGFEIGADVLKTHYTGSTDTFRSIVDTVFSPIVVLGGAPGGDDRATLENIHGAVASGASGIAMGRKIWAHDDPSRLVAALSEIIHAGVSVDTSSRIMNSSPHPVTAG